MRIETPEKHYDLVVVGGGMLARALYDRRQAKKARAKGDAQILEDAADA